MKKKKNNVKNSKNETIISIIIVILVLCLSIGWASFNTSFNVDSMVLVRIKSDIRITGFSYQSGTSGVISSGEEYNVKYASGIVTLPNANSTVTYKVEVSNMELASNVNMAINSITGLSNRLRITNISGYTLKSKICDDNNSNDCGTGAQKTFYITIGYAENGYDSSNQVYNFGLNFDFKKVHDIKYTGFANPPVGFNTAIDGDTPSIDLSADHISSIQVLSGGTTLVENTNYTYNNYILTFITPIRDDIFIVNPSVFTITYVLNGGTQAANQVTTFTANDNELIKDPTKEGSSFLGWYEETDFSGSVITSTNQLSGSTTLYAKWLDKAARIGNTYYDTLQQAISAVAANDTEVTIVVLKNIKEVLTVNAHQNINFDFQNYTLSNVESRPLFENYGDIKISNGFFTSSTSQGAFNVYSTGSLIMTGGRIETTGSKQGIWNNGGRVEISGSVYINSTSNQRAAVQNQTGGTMIITGGTIISTRFSAVENNGSLTIGVKDGSVSDSSPVFQGGTYGVNATTNYNYYDGVIKGKTLAINDESYVADIETGYEYLYGTESISGATYKTVHLDIVDKVHFDANGGTVSETLRTVKHNTAIGALPVPTYTNYIFDGWFTDRVNGTEVRQGDIIDHETYLYAHWTDASTIVIAKIGNTEYQSLQDAINAAPNNTETTITLMRNIIDNVTIGSTKNIVFDLQNYTITNKTAYSVITNNGRLKITNGTITTSSTSASAINNNSGSRLLITGGTIRATGQRQAIYNDGGTAEITGTAYLISSSSERATVQNQSGGTLTISGGTIISTGFSAVDNRGTLTIGIKDGTINSTSPIMQGKDYGITATSNYKFYDGIAKGKTDAINRNPSDTETGAVSINTTEIIDGSTYHVTYYN